MFDRGYKSQNMDGQREKFARLEDSSDISSSASDTRKTSKCGFSVEKSWHRLDNPTKSSKRGMRNGGLRSLGRSFGFGVSWAVFPEDLKLSEKKIFDPQDKFLITWNRLFLISCILAASVDPLFFYLPVFDKNSQCLGIDRNLAIISTTLRTVVDAFYLIRMALQFRTGYIAPSSRVFGRGELVIDPARIANRYLRHYFIIDLLSLLPLPQAVIWWYLHNPNGSDVLATKIALLLMVMLQFVPRLLRIFPLTSELKRTAGVIAQTAWFGAAYYLLRYILVGHAAGAFWYLLAIEREDDCWRSACHNNKLCNTEYLYCGNSNLAGYDSWNAVSANVIASNCPVDGSVFNYGIYGSAMTNGIDASNKFVSKFCFCFWWGLRNLSTLGQGMQTSNYLGENVFAIVLVIIGLVLFGLLLGNMQTYLQSLTTRLEEMRVKRRDSEQWMHHRLLPQELRARVRRYDHYKWLETRGVDEESVVESLPKDIRRDIKRHLCLALVKRVPLFEYTDERLLDAICERLKPSLYTENTSILREGDPVDEMLFIIRGRLESVTTDGGRSGFFNRGLLTEGDFCGEELLTWALDPKSGANLPSSTRSVTSLTEVEAFALTTDVLKYVASQFRRLHSRQLRHTFRYYSQQWRTWAATFIQAAWRRYSKRKLAELQRREEKLRGGDGVSGGTHSLGATIYASRFAANALRGVHRRRDSNNLASALMKLQKPPEPDFSAADRD